LHRRIDTLVSSIRPEATIDASCLVALDTVDLVPQLSLLFSRVLVPRAVRSELTRQKSTRKRRQVLLRKYAFLEPCDDYDLGVLGVFLAERVRTRTRDRGEMEAIAQAAKFSTAILIDDKLGRNLASRQSLEYHGTLWVLRRFRELDLITGSGLRVFLERLRKSGARIPVKEANELLIEIGENPFPPSSSRP
jgi:predicted nucleic acid-binding protein